jgi:bacteriorhodopsin
MGKDSAKAADSGTNAKAKRRATEAAKFWVLFIVLVVIINGTIPFVLGINPQGWGLSKATGSTIFGLVIYAGVFLALPLLSIKGWRTVREPAFLAK